MAPPLKLDAPQRTEIVSRYGEGESLTDLGKHFGVSHNTIARVLRSAGISVRNHAVQQRKYRCDDHYFDCIDSEPKAYWLGFIAADGCVTDGRRISLQVKLQGRDGGHLGSLRDSLSATNPVYRTGAGQAQFIVHSPQLIAGLAAQGIGPRKSLTLNWPVDLPANLLPHYLRGYMDGDGNWSTTGKQANVTVCGSFPFLLGLGEYLEGTLGFRQARLRACGNTHMMSYGGNRQIPTLARFLYARASVALPRKFQQIRHFL